MDCRLTIVSGVLELGGADTMVSPTPKLMDLDYHIAPFDQHIQVRSDFRKHFQGTVSIQTLFSWPV